MIKLIRELRRREVFRALGLYGGLCWLLIEVSSVLLPTFGWPDWMLRALITIAIIGFPVVAVLAWVYDLTERGVVYDTAEETAPAIGGRRMNFVVIGILAVALIFSVYMNFTRTASIEAPPEPVSVLIADFTNATGDAIFDGLLEQALNIGIEGAPHVTSFERGTAASLAKVLQTSANGLSAAAARLVAVREGIGLVLSGSIERAGSGFRLALTAVDPVGGEPAFQLTANTPSRDGVLAAIGALSEDVRKALGDNTLKRGAAATTETFTAASIEAAGAYMSAIEHAYDGRHVEAVERFRTATELDPNFGRAYSGWALSEFKLGRIDEARTLWDKALSLMSTMTERERLRTLGLYYASVTRNYAKAVESFSELVEKYPADAAGRNNLAVSAFLALDFETATREGGRILEIYPNSQLYRSNFALYAMYSGDFAAAAAQARAVIDDDPAYGTSYLPLAVALLAQGDLDGARETYRRMGTATTSEHGASLATLGLADVAVYSGELDEAQQILRGGIELDIGQNATSSAAVKQIALAEALLAAGDGPAANAAARAAVDLSAQDSIRIAAALVFLESGELESAIEIAASLSAQLNTHSRAYAMAIDAAILRQSGSPVEAIRRLDTALEIADLWRIRFERGRAYLDAGFFAEAFDELSGCLERRGEAAAMFLDDTPTFRRLAELQYWIARAQEGLGMQTAALASYQSFLALRPYGGPLADDARKRVE
jgi:eukaryotic-like serine/threonine-protein kinase